MAGLALLYEPALPVHINTTGRWAILVLNTHTLGSVTHTAARIKTNMAAGTQHPAKVGPSLSLSLAVGPAAHFSLPW